MPNSGPSKDPAVPHRDRPFPVTALMSRQAVDTLWLTLARADGATTRMGVTSEHPLFVTGEGWVSAGELAPGDQIRDAAFRALTVLAVKRDPAPRIVHNLEVAGAHTYFAGELEAWGRNARGRTSGNDKSSQQGRICHELLPGYLEGDFKKFTLPSGKQVDAISFDEGVVAKLKSSNPRSRDYRQLASYLMEIRDEFPDIDWIGVIMRY